MDSLLVSAVIHVDGSGAPCALQPLDEGELLNAVDTLQRHLAAGGVRVSLSTRRVRMDDDMDRPDRDTLTFNGIDAAALLSGKSGDTRLDAAAMLEAGLAAAEG
jgi:hypothetical protein